MSTSAKNFLLPLWILSMLAGSSTARGESAGQYIDDAALTAKVKAAMLADKSVKSTEISVETNRGIVKLSGAVDSRDQELLAVRDATQIKGVLSVNDMMDVRVSGDQ